jgi:undecaprenyl-diphosphatase
MADATGATTVTASTSSAAAGGGASVAPTGAIAVGMIWQRTLIIAHWFSDAVFGVIGGASATLVLWWAFSTLLAKDYAKPLFRRRIESPAHEGAS